MKSMWPQMRQMVGVCCGFVYLFEEHVTTDEADGGGLFTFLKST